MSKKYCLGIESTADDLGIGVVSFDGRILANIVKTYIPDKGGIHPREAAQHHSEVAGEALKEALEESNLHFRDVNIVAFSQGPGMGPCIRTGATVARFLAKYLNIPLVGVNHLVAHVEIGKLTTGAADPVILFVSGGSTIVSSFDEGRYRIFGETLDIPAGNCIDVFARETGLSSSKEMPAAAKVEKLARNGVKYIELPYTVKGMDLSFSGLLTSASNLLHMQKHRLEDICFSFQETLFSMLTEITERALAHTEKKEILLTGGVAANTRLQSMLRMVAEEHGSRFCYAPKKFALDNGAMIAWTGILSYNKGITIPVEKSYVRLKWRLDEVPIPWVEDY